MKNMKQFSEFSIKRYCMDIDPQEINSIELHGFGDASKEAYGACIYIRYERNSKVCCNLVTSKTCVAPMSLQSIPRLELWRA